MTMLNKYFEILINEAKSVKYDIPVAALIVKEGKIIALEKNRREEDNSTISHAEILAIQKANKLLMYVTLEPCPMCAWAIINSRISNLYFGSYDSKYGAMGSILNLKALAKSKINVYGGIKEKECNELLENYFKELRNEK